MNLLVIPAAFVILLAGVMSLMCAPFGGFLTEVFNHAAWAVSSFLTLCIQWAADVPGGHWFIRTPPAAGVIGWYVILAAAAVMARRLRGALAAGVALLAALALAWGIHDARRCRVSVLDVGEGNAVLVQAQSARLLVDVGPKFRAEDTLRLLRREGVNRLDLLVLTHPDAQHMGAAQFLMRELPVGELWVPVRLWPSPLMRDVLQEAETQSIPIRRLRAGDAGDWPGHMAWEVLWPPDSLKLSCADDAALVMRVARFGVSILLAGDAGSAQEQALLTDGRSLAASVLLAGRHGDATATSARWLEAVRPREAIISAGPHSDGRHPDETILARLLDHGVRVWRTDQQGTIVVDLAGIPARWPDSGYRIQSNP
jgi:beta-lactamase superfamily II metal-dependent hydrolase